MPLRSYQADFDLNNLYEIQITPGSSGLGEILRPRITALPGTVTVYGSEKEPTGLTLANIATKMVLIKDDVVMDPFVSIPNYLAIVQKSGTSTELVFSSISIIDDLGVIPA